MYKEKGVYRNCPRGGLAFLTFKERGGGGTLHGNHSFYISREGACLASPFKRIIFSLYLK